MTTRVQEYKRKRAQMYSNIGIQNNNIIRVQLQKHIAWDY